MEPAIPSCQKMPTKLKSGGELKFAKGNFSKGERFSHKAFNPDEYEVFSTKKFNPKENNSSPAKIRMKPWI